MDKQSANGIPNESTNAASGAGQNNVDEELSKLLDSSLQDFGKATTVTTDNKPNANVTLDELGASASFDKEAAQRAAVDFQNMLRQLSEMQKVMMEQVKTGGVVNVDASDAAATGGNNSLSEDQSSASAGSGSEEIQFAQAFLQNLNFLADKAQKVQQAGNEEELESAIRELQTDTEYENEFLPFMQGLMSSLLSKDTLYPSLKEMADKYPTWLEENRHKIEPALLERYEAQLSLINEACKEFEEEKDDDPDDVKGQRFDRLITIMQKMQACGSPPEDLVGALPPGMSLDEQTGIPNIVDQDKAAESCSIM